MCLLECSCSLRQSCRQNQEVEFRDVRLSGFNYFLKMASPALVDYMLSFWDVTSVITCGKTNSATRGRILSYMSLEWNLRRHFMDWFRDDLQEILHKCGAVISGSQAIQFFDRERYPESDVDFFVRLGGADELVKWIVCQGYSITDFSKRYRGNLENKIQELSAKCTGNLTSFEHPILGVINLLKPRVADKKVQVIIVDVDPIEHVLYGFHSSKSTLIYSFTSSRLMADSWGHKFLIIFNGRISIS